MKNICILGSTGSIGKQALDVIEKEAEFKVLALSAGSNFKLLYEQALKFKPNYVVIMSMDGYNFLKENLKPYGIKVLYGMDGLLEISSLKDSDIILNSVVGMVGLRPTIEALKVNKTVALANKETLVAGGEIIKELLKTSKGKIIPVDSEHSAIFQCLFSGKREEVNRLIITASGGPFRGKKREELVGITPEMAVKHPNWSMGRKISVDSATLMNKGLEVIEAHFLFDIPYEKIDVIVHPQSTIHSMVEYIDGSIIAQMGRTDMRHPIQYALNYPKRASSASGYLDFDLVSSLNFEKPDLTTFESLKLCYEAGKTGGTMTCVLNSGNEEAVKLFFDRKISFLDIPKLVKEAIKNHKVEYKYDLQRILEIERETRNFINSLAK